MTRRIDWITYAFFAAALLIAAGVSLGIIHTVRSALDASEWVVHTHQVQSGIEHLEAALRAAQSGADRNAARPSEEARRVFERGQRDTREAVARLRALVSDNARQEERIDELHEAIRAYLTHLQRVFDAAGRASSPDLAASLSQQAEALARRVFDQLDAIGFVESELLRRRSEALESESATAEWSIPLATLLVFALLGSATALVWRDHRRRETAEAALRKLNAELEQRVRERTASLDAANATLLREAERRERTMIELERWKQIIERTSDCVAVTDAEGRLVFLNRSARALVGMGEDEPLGRLTLAALQPDWARQLLALRGLPHALEHGTWYGESALLGDDGREIRVSQVIVSHRNAQGELDLVSHVARDITELKRAYDDLKASRDAFRQVARIASDYFWELDEQFRFRQISRELEERSGIPVSPLIGKARWEVDYLGMDAAKWAEHRACLEAHRPFRNLELGMVNAKGVERWFLISGEPVFDADGGFTGYRGATLDITERRRTEAALRASEAQFRALARVSPVGIYRTDANGDCLYVNERWCEIAGMAREAALGKGWVAAIHPEDRDLVATEWYAAAHAERPFRLECRFQRPNGGVTWVISQATAELNAAGEAVGWVGCVTDISELRAARDALRSHAQQVLDAQEEERRALARELHDQFGQELAALKLDLEHLAQGAHDLDEARRIGDCLEIADAAIEHVRDRALNLRPSVLDDLGLTEALHWFARRQCERGGCEVRVLAPAGEIRLAPRLETAAFRIAQEAVNNAIRHGGAKRVDIYLGIESDRLCMSVRDDGSGFDPGEALRGAREGRSFGLLGMRERAQLLGGQLRVRSAPGEGSEIEAWFPSERMAA